MAQLLNQKIKLLRKINMKNNNVTVSWKKNYSRKPGHTQLKFKCKTCGLKFIVLTWYADWQLDRAHYCPQCGKKDHIIWVETCEAQIRDIVPGNARPSEMNPEDWDGYQKYLKEIGQNM